MAKRIGILTSGGDAPGMNAVIRSVVRVGISQGWKVMGIYGGYQGLLAGDLVELNARSVSNIIQRGGTILRTSRCEEFKTPEGREKAKNVLVEEGIDGLVLVGGDGTFHGGVALGEIWKGSIIGLPGTIDNDVWGTDFTIGYDTAINTALDAIDKIRDTAEAHERVFLVEVMGRLAGFIALEACIAGGAEEVLVPEYPSHLQDICDRLIDARKRGKTSSIIVVAEGNSHGSAFEVAKKLQAKTNAHYRVVVLGYVQRGGKPSARDRVLATKLGAYAIQVLDQGVSGVMVGEVGGRLVTTPLRETWERKKPLDPTLLSIAPLLGI